MRHLNLKIFLTTVVWLPIAALAQDLVPATSEDLEAFDRQLLNAIPAAAQNQDTRKQEARGEAKKNRPALREAVVSEAKRLKDDKEFNKRGFEQWVKSKNRDREDRTGNQSSGSGSAGGGDKDNSSSAAEDARRQTGSDDDLKDDNAGNNGNGNGNGRGRGRNRD